MCEAAAGLYGGCLASSGLEWSAAGYQDEADYIEACGTWAWEMRILEEEAKQAGATDQACLERTALFSSGTCDDYTAIDWSLPPWEETP